MENVKENSKNVESASHVEPQGETSNIESKTQDSNIQTASHVERSETSTAENKTDSIESKPQDSNVESNIDSKENIESKIIESAPQIKKQKPDYVFYSMEKPPQSAFENFKQSIKFSLGMDLVKGMGLTIKEFFSKPVTINYPFEAQPLSPRYRAVHNLQRLLDSGNERCIGCGLCEKICTSNCIRILTHEGEDGRKKIDSYTINLGRCIYCGLCAEVCPELAIVMGPRFENASEQRAHFGLKEDFLKPKEEAINHTQQEFQGFGSPRPTADKEIHPTPQDY